MLRLTATCAPASLEGRIAILHDGAGQRGASPHCPRAEGRCANPCTPVARISESPSQLGTVGRWSGLFQQKSQAACGARTFFARMKGASELLPFWRGACKEFSEDPSGTVVDCDISDASSFLAKKPPRFLEQTAFRGLAALACVGEVGREGDRFASPPLSALALPPSRPSHGQSAFALQALSSPSPQLSALSSQLSALSPRMAAVDDDARSEASRGQSAVRALDCRCGLGLGFGRRNFLDDCGWARRHFGRIPCSSSSCGPTLKLGAGASKLGSRSWARLADLDGMEWRQIPTQRSSSAPQPNATLSDHLGRSSGVVQLLPAHPPLLLSSTTILSLLCFRGFHLLCLLRHHQPSLLPCQARSLPFTLQGRTASQYPPRTSCRSQYPFQHKLTSSQAHTHTLDIRYLRQRLEAPDDMLLST